MAGQTSKTKTAKPPSGNTSLPSTRYGNGQGQVIATTPTAASTSRRGGSGSWIPDELMKGAVAYGANFVPPTADSLNAMTPELSAYAAGLAQEQQDPFQAFLDQFDGGGGGAGGGGSNLGGELSAIAQAYQTQLDELNRQRDAGSTEITASRTAADQAITKRQADNTQQSTEINNSIMGNYSAALERQSKEAAALAAELQRFGVDPSKIAPGTTQSASYVSQARDAQSALQSRLGQVANDAMSSRNQNLDLIAQGAQGTLTNNYAQVKMQMDLARQQQEAAAAAAARSSGGSGSSGLDQAMQMLKLQDLYQNVTGTGPTSSADFLKQNGQYDLSVLQPGSAAYIAAVSGGSPDSVLKNLYTTQGAMTDNAGNPILDSSGSPKIGDVFDAKGYSSAYQDLARAMSSQRAVANGDTSQRVQYKVSSKVNDATTKLKNAVAKITFRNR